LEKRAVVLEKISGQFLKTSSYFKKTSGQFP